MHDLPPVHKTEDYMDSRLNFEYWDPLFVGRRTDYFPTDTVADRWNPLKVKLHRQIGRKGRGELGKEHLQVQMIHQGKESYIRDI